MRYVFLITIIALNGCYQEFDIQINPYVCVNGFKWNIEGDAITDDFGAQETCLIRAK